jgi:hypothetical protein
MTEMSFSCTLEVQQFQERQDLPRAVAEIFRRLDVRFGPTDEDVLAAAHLLKTYMGFTLPPLYDGDLGPAGQFKLSATVGFLARDRHSSMQETDGVIAISFEREKFSLTFRPVLLGAKNGALTVECNYHVDNPWPALQTLSALAAFNANDAIAALSVLAVMELAAK